MGGIISATNTTSGDLALTAATDIVANGVDTAAGAVAGTPSVALTAQAGSISQAAGGTISATNTTSGDLALTAATDILSNSAVTGAGAMAGTPSVALTAQAGSISLGAAKSSPPPTPHRAISP